MSATSEVVVRKLAASGALIVGGTSGVGLACAVAFARSGVPRIALVGRTAERGERARQAVLAVAPQTQLHFIQGDANIIEQAGRIVGDANQALGGIDILVNCTADVARYTPEPLQQIAPENIPATLLSVTMAPLVMSRLVLPLMRARGGGVILNLASDAAKVPTPGETILGAAMAAIVMFSRTLAMEAKRFGVRVNVLTPSLIAGTPTAQHVQAAGFSAKLFSKIESMASLGVCVPEDLAAMILFLASPEAAKITGQAISVNGGISAG